VSRLEGLFPGLLFVLALALYLPRLAVPDRYIFDEVYHAYTAGQYAAGNSDAYVWYTRAPREGVAYMWNHPPAGVLIISAGIRLWGDQPFGWRFMSGLFGALGIAVAYLLARSLTARIDVALLAAFLLMMDGLYFVQARTGMLDIFGVVFMLAALLCFHRAWLCSPDRAFAWLAGTGVFVGLAVATKWNAAYAASLLGLAALARAVWTARRPPSEGGAALGPSLLAVAIGLILIPACIYALAYVPFLLSGHGVRELIELQRQIFLYHSRLQATHGYASSWWEWPLVLRPVWYHVTRGEEWMANIYALANPLLHWALLPAVLWLTWVWESRRDPGLATLLIGFFGQWLPWALVPRISFAYHFLPAVPLGCVALAMLLAHVTERGSLGAWVTRVYVLLIALAFVFFYPILAAVPLSREALALRMWLPGWP
jgi:dolichyl-phosphate-mannose-protein mannosyltransferase